MKMTFKVVALCVAVTTGGNCVYGMDDLATELRDVLAAGLTAPDATPQLHDIMSRSVRSNNVNVAKTITTIFPEFRNQGQSLIRDAIQLGHAEIVIHLLSENIAPPGPSEFRSPLLNFMVINPLESYRLEWRIAFLEKVLQSTHIKPEDFIDIWGNTIETYKDQIPDEVLALYRKRFTADENPWLITQVVFRRKPRISGKPLYRVKSEALQFARLPSPTLYSDWVEDKEAPVQ